ncbi:hypothetical protein [Lewinella sp. 4G2]|uniref:hypothetical protein n=1 Tax=Lewinella sp. 4G2 TaxID=1803372 RepID=UPI0007B4E429|nr:hypothetical protein [Lewinella sp. 4G2]OAV43626.1 hypothetical protein A3850_003555 [Lewinella sp. 4G2]
MAVVFRNIENVEFTFYDNITLKYRKIAFRGDPDIHLPDIIYAGQNGMKEPKRGYVKIHIENQFVYWGLAVTFNNNAFFVLYCPPGFYDKDQGEASEPIIIDTLPFLKSELKKSTNCNENGGLCL